MADKKTPVTYPFTASTPDTPLDVRVRVQSAEDIANIALAWKGMLVYVVSEDKYYKIKTLKAHPAGIQNYYPDTWEVYAPEAYRLVPSQSSVKRDTEGTPYVSYVNCVAFKNTEPIEDDNIYYIINGERKYHGAHVELAKGDGIENIEFQLMPESSQQLGGITLGSATTQTPLASVVVSVVSDGVRGAVLRGPSEWKTGVEYQGGNEGDAFQDIVLCKIDDVIYYYLCRYTHTSSSDNSPWNHNASTAWDASRPWEASQISGFVATKVLFAERSIINNLALNGAAAYPMVVDGQGNYTDQINTEATPTVTIDGNTGLITANGGVFNNITVNKGSTFYGVLKASVVQTEAQALYRDSTWHDIDLVNDPHTTYDITYDNRVIGTQPSATLPDASLYEGLELEFKGVDCSFFTYIMPCAVVCDVNATKKFLLYYKGQEIQVTGIGVFGYAKVKSVSGAWLITDYEGPFTVQYSGAWYEISDNAVVFGPTSNVNPYNITLFDNIIVDKGAGVTYQLPGAVSMKGASVKIVTTSGTDFDVKTTLSTLYDYDNTEKSAGTTVTRSHCVEYISDGIAWHEIFFSN